MNPSCIAGRKRDFFFSWSSQRTDRPQAQPASFLMGAGFPSHGGQSVRGLKVTRQLLLMSILGVSVDTDVLPSTPTWHSKGQLCVLLLCSLREAAFKKGAGLVTEKIRSLLKCCPKLIGTATLFQLFDFRSQCLQFGRCGIFCFWFPVTRLQISFRCESRRTYNSSPPLCKCMS